MYDLEQYCHFRGKEDVITDSKALARGVLNVSKGGTSVAANTNNVPD